MTTVDAKETTAPARFTLPGTDYYAPEVYETERERIFLRNWLYACRAERLAEPGNWVTLDLVGESILLVRGKDHRIRGFYNVCRHRGTRLCEEPSGSTRSHLRCPYHAWGYGLDGQLVTTPNVDRDEIDRSNLSLWPVHVDTWQGFVFVSLDRDQPPALIDWLGTQYDEPLTFEKYQLGDLKLGHISRCTVQANWKVVIENYNECLHCPTVHPELVEVIPAYKKGWVFQDDRTDGGVTLAEGRTGVTADPRSRLPLLPGMSGQEAESYYGATFFPNMFFDLSGQSAIATAVFPTGPETCELVSEYLFHPDAVAADDFDPRPDVEFNDLVTQQDNEVCERVQRGIRSRAFDHGVYPAKDRWVYEFDQRYLRERDGG